MSVQHLPGEETAAVVLRRAAQKTFLEMSQLCQKLSGVLLSIWLPFCFLTEEHFLVSLTLWAMF